MLAACKVTVGVQNPDAQAWRAFANFYAATQQPRSAREMALKWLRQVQTRGWHEDAVAALEVAACGDLLARCVFAISLVLGDRSCVHACIQRGVSVQRQPVV